MHPMAGERKPSESDTLEDSEESGTRRLVEITRIATSAFGDAEKARRWLRKPNRALGGEKPVDLLATARGTALVHQILGNIEYGGVF